MTLLVNILRVLFACVWTGVVGVPLIVSIYVSWAYGLLRAWFGRRDVLDRVLEANAYFTGWVAQRLWASVLLPVTGIRLRTREVTPVDWDAAHVICANHASVFDILALVRAVPPPFRFVAKRELLKWPIIGWALRPAGQIVVDRSDHSSAMRSMTAPRPSSPPASSRRWAPIRTSRSIAGNSRSGSSTNGSWRIARR